MQRALSSVRGSTAVAVETPTRAAIYTRKSTTEGIDSGFSSIDAQRQAAENFVASQIERGWVCLPKRYDDFGFSGGTMVRPGMTELCADVDADLIDVLVVVRLDRIGRNLSEFVRFHEFLTNRGVALVSVSESIDSSTAHGRMLIGILATFAEYERSLASQRTREKIRGAKQKGRRCGGVPVLGFDCDPKGAQLLINQAEAEIVREIFRLFLANRSLVSTVAELERRHWTLKRWKTREGKDYGGGRFDVHSLRRMLANHVYEGRVLFEGKLYDGEHDAIISSKVFREVQDVLGAGRRDTRPGVANKYGCLLRGLLFCSCGSPMTHTPTTKGSRLFRYYRCAASMRRGAATCTTRSVRAVTIEDFVVGEVRRIGADPKLQHETFQQAVAQVEAEHRAARVEARRLKRELVTGKQDLARLVDVLSRTIGTAGSAVQEHIATAQDRVERIEARLAEVLSTMKTLAAQHVDEADVASALRDFDGVWSALVLSEKERLLHLLISAVRYDGANGTLAIEWWLEGFGALAAEVTGG